MLGVFFNDTATTEIYTLSLHDALPILEREYAEPQHNGLVNLRCAARVPYVGERHGQLSRLGPYHAAVAPREGSGPPLDRKSTRLNSSHANISYAVFCLKKKNQLPGCSA